MSDDAVAQHDRTGLRERKKQATRQALHDAALRLTLERGLEHLTVEDISAAAEVSPRTFFNYFPGKEQAIIGDDLLAVEAQQVTAIMAAAPTILDGMKDIALTVSADTVTRREQVLLRWRVITRYPALITRMFARLEEFNAIVASAVAARLGMAPDDAYPQLMAAMTTAGIRVAVQRWTAGHGDDPLERHMAEVFGLLKSEFAAAQRT
ncbi:MAG TPA: TetR family transcriptional regulator [Streptosporangiaceae bacterium]|nr:TetR family transcriptional regulator [Streptosporangiaceae bacterium]